MASPYRVAGVPEAAPGRLLVRFRGNRGAMVIWCSVGTLLSAIGVLLLWQVGFMHPEQAGYGGRTAAWFVLGMLVAFGVGLIGFGVSAMSPVLEIWSDRLRKQVGRREQIDQPPGRLRAGDRDRAAAGRALPHADLGERLHVRGAAGAGADHSQP